MVETGTDPHRIFIEPSRTGLLVIDIQNGFVHPESSMGKSPSGTKAQQGIIPHIVSLIKFCREKQIPVFWSQQEHFAEDQTRLRKVIKPHSARQGFLPCLRGSWETDFYSEIKQLIAPNDFIIQKHRASVFYNTNFETKLKMLNLSCLLIAGCNTEFCVESTVRDAYARDFDLIIFRDGVAGINPHFHKNSLDIFKAYFGEVLGLNEIQEMVR